MIKQQFLRNVMIVLGLVVSGLNIYLLTMPTTQMIEHVYPHAGGGGGGDDTNTKRQHQQRKRIQNNAHVQIGADFFQSRKVVEETKLQVPTTIATTTSATSSSSNNNPNRNRKRILIGILSADTFNDLTYRKRHRELFAIWNDKRVCSLAEYRKSSQVRNDCWVLYTFVLGAADPLNDVTAPTELLSNTTTHRLIERPKPIAMTYATDCNEEDVTLLNIRENMNDGKSPTFFYWASLIMDHDFSSNHDNDNDTPKDTHNNNNDNNKNAIHYAMKLDADAILHLHDFLLFCDTQLPPPPYANLITVGALRNKAPWPKHDDVDLPRYDSYWGNQFEGVHLYVAGQAYMLSHDLCRWVAQEAPFSKVRIGAGGYVEGHEDHDVSAMIAHHAEAIHTISIGKSQRFWEHPVKGQPRWDRIVKRETARMKKEEFEGKVLRLY